MLAKSKLNRIGTLISQAITDRKICHEEFEAIINEKEKYETMKENIRTMKSSYELGENNKNITEYRINVQNEKNSIFYMYYIFQISAEKQTNAKIQTTVSNRRLFENA